jgi:hypothetical protein
MRSKIFMPAAMFLVLFAGVVADVMAVTASEYAVIINLAGRQRMLTQKMSKEMLLIAKGVDVEANRTALKATAGLFDTTLNGLIKGNDELGLPPTEGGTTLGQLGKVQALWAEFNEIVTAVVNGGEVPLEKMATLNLPLLKNMNTAVRLYEKEAQKVTGRSAGVVINLSGKQRMLTQKMSKEMLLVALNYKVEENKANLRGTVSLFDRTLKGLRDGDADLGLPPTTDAGIVAQLDKVASIWQQFKPVVDRAGDVNEAEVSSDDLQQMVQLNLPLLKEMNAAVKMYEQAEQ